MAGVPHWEIERGGVEKGKRGWKIREYSGIKASYLCSLISENGMSA